ncbi:MAG: acyl carrier protein [Anaerolineales bacterium]|nr:acyl carrier protein [Anaerolineales bacterium]
MSADQTQQKIAVFFARHLHTADIAADQDVFTAGLVNSLFAVQIVMFVENEFGLTVENEDLELDNFRSINAITGFVARKQAALTT